MKKPTLKIAMIAVAAVLFVLYLSRASVGAGDEDKEPKIRRPGGALVFPLLEWSRAFPHELNGVAVAKKTGETVALTRSKLYYFDGDSPDPAWTAEGDPGWKHTQSLGVSWDGSRIMGVSHNPRAVITIRPINLREE